MATTTKGRGLQVDGLEESIKALKRLGPEYRKEAINVIRDVVKDVQQRSQSRVGNHRDYRLPKKRSMI